MVLTVEAYDANFEPLGEDKIPDHRLPAELMPPERSSTGAEPQRAFDHPAPRGRVRGPRPMCPTAVEYRARVKDPVTGDTSEVGFQVASLSAERRSATRNASLQEEIVGLDRRPSL